jgi:hypothetical protein
VPHAFTFLPSYFNYWHVPFTPRKRTLAVQLSISALGHYPCYATIEAARPQGRPTARLVEKRDPRTRCCTLKIARKFLMLFVRFSAPFEKNC